MIAAVLGAIASTVSFFGWIWWPVDLLANFRAHFAVGLLATGVLLLLSRRRRPGWFVILVGLFNAAVVIPLFIAPLGGSPSLGTSLTVMTFNVNGLNGQHDAVIEYIESQRPDVVFIHEATFVWEDALVAAGLSYRVEPGRRDPLDFGTLALVPEGAEFKTFGFANADPRAVEVVLSVAGEPVRILGIHPLSPATEERAALRDNQLAFATDWAASGAGRTIVAGDFNATPWSFPVRQMLANGELVNSQRGFGLDLTFPAMANPVTQVAIDHVMYSAGFEVVGRRLGPASGSDHYPVVVDFVLVGL